MRIEVHDTYTAMSRRAAGLIMAELKRRPNLLLCASAGNTPKLTYQLLAAQRSRRPHLFGKMRVLQLDEWGGLPPSHPASCYADLQSSLLGPLAIATSRFRGFRGDAADPQAECRRMTDWLAANGPLDLSLLGLGLNGHIAMNEPAASLEPGVHVTDLTTSSRKHSMLRGMKRKPAFGLTLGFTDILASRKVILLVSGAEKAAILKRALGGEVTTRFPASFLHLHSDLTLLCDRAAASDSDSL